MSDADLRTKAVSEAKKPRRLLLAFAIVTAVLMFTPVARVLVYIFPFASVILSYYLLRVSRSDYVELVSWLYMLTPLVRRVVDYKTGNPETTLMSAPYLATAMCVVVLLSRWRKVANGKTAPVICILATICYGGATTLVHSVVLGMIKGMFAWLAPLMFCFFILAERHRAREFYAAFERAMVWGTFVLGFYGLIQYLIMPAWDRVWMDINQVITFGQAEPFQVRVFSTMNAPQVLGAYLLVGVLISFTSQRKLRFAAIPVGVLALCLSMSRSAWVSMAAGVAYLCWQLPTRERTKLIMGAGACTILLLAAMQVPAVNETLAPRFSSLLDVKHDDSAGERSEVYSTVFQTLLKSPFGLGVGVESEGGDTVSDAEHDSSFVNLLLSFGVLGSLAFGSGLLVIVGRLLFSGQVKNVSYLLPLKAATFTIIVEAFVNNVLTGPNAFLTWSVLGFGLAFREQLDGPRITATTRQTLAGIGVEVSPTT